MSEWKPIETAPNEGKFLVAEYAPTNWAYYVKTINADNYHGDRVRESNLRYCTHWMPMPPQPCSKAQ